MRVLGGVVGAMVTGTARSTRTIQAIVSTLEIDITDIVRREFVEALRSDPIYGSRLAERGRYQFELEIPSFAIFKPNLLTPDWIAGMRSNWPSSV